MAEILERYRTAAHGWSGHARDTRRKTEPLAHFLEQVDRLFYLAAGVFAVCIIALILD